jgi:hypothetical protein
LDEHKAKVEDLGKTLSDIVARLDNFGDEVKERVESPQYLALVRKSSVHGTKQILKKRSKC